MPAWFLAIVFYVCIGIALLIAGVQALNQAIDPPPAALLPKASVEYRIQDLPKGEGGYVKLSDMTCYESKGCFISFRVIVHVTPDSASQVYLYREEKGLVARLPQGYHTTVKPDAPFAGANSARIEDFQPED